MSQRTGHVHDLQATILHLLGIDHERLTYKFQGREFHQLSTVKKQADSHIKPIIAFNQPNPPTNCRSLPLHYCGASRYRNPYSTILRNEFDLRTLILNVLFAYLHVEPY